jgi:hypothetical protein
MELWTGEVKPCSTAFVDKPGRASYSPDRLTHVGSGIAATTLVARTPERTGEATTSDPNAATAETHSKDIGPMEIVLDKRALRQIRTSAADAIEEGDTETLREDVLDVFSDEQVEEIERRIDTDFYDFLGDALDEWGGEEVDELLDLLESHLADVGIELKFEGVEDDDAEEDEEPGAVDDDDDLDLGGRDDDEEELEEEEEDEP